MSALKPPQLQMRAQSLRCAPQVTPVFGILNDIEARRSDARLAAAAPPPSRVVFVYVASQKNELALLQRRSVADARCVGARHTSAAWRASGAELQCLSPRC